jgi:hypothetical protein
MSKFDNMNKQTIPDPLTGGLQDIYTSQDGTFMMCIPDRAIPCATTLPEVKTMPLSDDGITKKWSWEIIQPKQIENG